MGSTLEHAPGEEPSGGATDPGVGHESTLDELQADFDALKSAWNQQGGLPYKQRMAYLGGLQKWIKANRQAIVDAAVADFGGRSPHETLFTEVFMVVDDLRHIRAHLAEWMEEQPRPVTMAFKPGSAKVVFQPVGVVGVISPWNYPFQLAISPLVAAIAAGCRVLLKPSELTPRTCAVIRRMVGEVLSPEVCRVVVGGPEIGAAFSRLAFDHLLFTGSPALGKHVMRAAAENLTPVTLELGGKSPAIVHPSFPLARAAARIAVGRFANAGQTCVAPDYVIVEKGQRDRFVEEMQATIRKAYPTLLDNPDYTAIISDRHYARLRSWVQDAKDKGATVIEVNPAGETLPDSRRKLPPTLVLDGTDDMIVLQEELFGPILPIVTVDSIDEAIAYVNARPRPLALYYFDWNSRRCDDILARTTSGGVCLNETVMHPMQAELPFGGIGNSGMGAYHGWYGFKTFSHEKAVYSQTRVTGTSLLAPPYGRLFETVLRFLIG